MLESEEVEVVSQYQRIKLSYTGHFQLPPKIMKKKGLIKIIMTE